MPPWPKLTGKRNNLTFEALGLHPDSFVDHIHPNDYGMLQYAEAYAKLIREILKP
jgi:hypothetical protein